MRSLTSAPNQDAARNSAGTIISANICACTGTTPRPRRSRASPRVPRFSFFFSFLLFLDSVFLSGFNDHVTTSRPPLTTFSFAHFLSNLFPLQLLCCYFFFCLLSPSDRLCLAFVVIIFVHAVDRRRRARSDTRPPFRFLPRCINLAAIRSPPFCCVLITPHVDPCMPRLYRYIVFGPTLSIVSPLSLAAFNRISINCIMKSRARTVYVLFFFSFALYALLGL